MKIIPLESLLIMLLPVTIVGFFYWKWIGKAGEIPMAALRMISQLLLVGYILNALFANNRWEVALGILTFMIFVSSVIALRSHSRKTWMNYRRILISVLIGGSFNLSLVMLVVVRPEPLYELKTLIPLAGMIYSNAMNAISLGGERFWKQVDSGSSYVEARRESFRTALIPQMNSFLAVGLVSLPGMMTGQVLSGVSPLIAVRYQIMVMCMVMGTSGMSVISYLTLCARHATQTQLKPE
jgi:putative ABC transport system permease protein